MAVLLLIIVAAIIKEIAGQQTDCPAPVPFVNLASHFIQRKIAEGRHQYEVMESQAKIPRFGSCWKGALSHLKEGCETLTDDSQARMALKFTSCFLEMNGLPGINCRQSQEVGDCVKASDVKAFTAYTHFFTHTQNMCFFLQSQIWHEEAEKMINKLTVSSVQVGHMLQNASELQRKMLEAQIESLQNQDHILKNSSVLEQVLLSSRMTIEGILDGMEEFRTSTDQQKIMLIEVFDRLENVQGLVLGEMSWLYTLAFYIGMLVIVCTVTSMSRTKNARFWMLLVLSLNFLVERLVTTYTLRNFQSANGFPESIRELLYNRIWFCRNISLVICVAILLWFAYRFQDYNKINNMLLMEIREQNFNIQEKLGSLYAMTKASETKQESKEMDRPRPSHHYNLRRSSKSPATFRGQRLTKRQTSVADILSSDEDSYLHEW